MAEETKLPRLESAGRMGRIMADYFKDLDAAAKNGKEKVAWCTSVGPAELLRALGFRVYFPENHGAMLGASRMATEMIPAANAIGYSPDICSYLTADIGSYLNKKTPMTKAFGMEGPPKPDVLVFNTNQCRDVQDWFAWYAREFDAPLLGVYTHRNIGDIEPHQVGDIARQIENLVEPLEAIAGRKLEMAELKKRVALSRECSDLWKAVLDTAAHEPSPITFFDGTIHMGPAVCLRGTQTAVDYYKEALLPELEARMAGDIGAVSGERFRLYWDGMPIWGRLRDHSRMFAELGVNVLASTYCNSWIFTALDPDDPFGSMAEAYTELFIVRSDAAKEAYIQRMLDFFKVDGVIYHDAKTCPNNSNCRYGMPQRLEKETGIPSLIINGDLNDLRLVSDEQNKTNVEAFVEQLEEA
jgi:benzoyl-CoA reductase/2-hydroxyglutaryl-CoA dehydratase subunit BcrC/BadD/HgdB